MALDQQRNWTVSMEKNFEKIMRLSQINETKQDDTKRDSGHCSELGDSSANKPMIWTTPPVHLPDEIIIQILEYIASSRQAQYSLASCCHLSKQWYAAALPLLYRHPFLYGKNFDPFVRTISPSINLHVRHSPLAELVKVLDMSNLVHQGSRSLTARLLRRAKDSLESFTAPQASFAINCFPALSKCRNLQVLDLSLVSESPPLLELFRSVRNLEKLEVFRFPRSAGFGANFDQVDLSWPPHLLDLSLSGGIDSHFTHGMVALPPSLRKLTIEHCPPTKSSQLLYFLCTSVQKLPNLQELRIANLPRLHNNSLDSLLLILPKLSRLSVSVDYITADFFDLREQMTTWLSRGERPWSGSEDPDIQSLHAISRDADQMPGARLRVLELTNSNKSGVEDKISPVDLLIAIEDNSLFPNLRQVRVARSLFWQSGENSREADALTSALEGLSATRKAAGEIERESDEVGVWTIDG